MGYLPIYIDVNQSKILVIGGSTIATEKIEKLLSFTQDITIITLTLSPKLRTLIQTHDLVLKQKAYERDDIIGYDIVIVATDSSGLHESIYKESRGKNILVNSVDNMKYCDFIFPSFVKQGALTIAISTGGTSPAFAKQMRQYLETILPNGIENFLNEMQTLRTTLPKGKERMCILKEKVKHYFFKNFP